MTESSSIAKEASFSSTHYDPVEIEGRWQKLWLQNGIDQTTSNSEDQKHFYALSMFPYPSGNLHMGHVRNYVITDVIARVQRMRGDVVLHPMGWDAFGLPAENAAIERNVEPGQWTDKNIQQMRSQLDRLGLSIDWTREQATCHSNYYRWTQWLFLELFEAGLAYQQDATVNWDPIDKTVLANEQVDAEGRSWRSGAIVEKRKLRQWFLRITNYADELIDDLDKLKGWPERVRTMQANWIGRSQGTEIDFQIENDKHNKITVFTTRADTLFGASYLVLAPEHSLVDQLCSREHLDEITAFRDLISDLSSEERTNDERPKRGVPIGCMAINPANGELLPIWIADYVLADYGTGAVMGVPAHDARDFLFARRHELPILQVICPPGKDHPLEEGQAWTGPGLMINSGDYNGLTNQEGKAAITSTGIKQGWAKHKVQYRLRDWLISRQRYWGCPIPIIHCKNCGAIPVQRKDLPVVLPRKIDLSGKGGNPLDHQSDWGNICCPECGDLAKRETDTMDTFMCSSWYFLRFIDPNNDQLPFSRDLANKWLPVNQYVGGIEHAILHLLYARFFTKALNDRGLIDVNEPFEKLLTQGMVQSITYKNPVTGKYISPTLIVDNGLPSDPETGQPLEVLFEKMSKSKHNGVDPASVIDRYGADTARMFILFKAPPEKDLEWDDADVEGQYRFLQRLWRLVHSLCRNNSENNNADNNKGKISFDLEQPDYPDPMTEDDIMVRRAVHIAIREVSKDLSGDYQFNTAIAELMKLSNILTSSISKVSIAVLYEAISVLVRLLAPFSPHLAEEFWMLLNGTGSVHKQIWPQIDETALIVDKVEVVIQVKGKVRGKLQVPADTDNATLEKIALESDVAQRWLEGNTPRRVIVIPSKLINFVP